MKKKNCKGLYFTLRTYRPLKNFNERSDIVEFWEGYSVIVKTRMAQETRPELRSLSEGCLSDAGEKRGLTLGQ